jgi:hypothetical protein
MGWAPFAGLVGVVLGFVLGFVKDWKLRRNRTTGHWGALKEEIEICADFAETYLNAGVMAPLYRLPRAALASSLSALLADGDITRGEYRALTLFGELVADINRGLDRVGVAHEHNDLTRAQVEGSRLTSKCHSMLNDFPDGRPSYLTLARGAVTPHVC